MKAAHKFWLMIVTLPAILLLSGCSNTGSSKGVHTSGSVQSVYGGYGYPYYGYPYYDDDYYEDLAEQIQQRREKGQERRQERRENRPGTQPVERSRPPLSTSMGRPSRSQMGARMPRLPRGGGLRRR